jgi:hypothetical protein
LTSALLPLVGRIEQSLSDLQNVVSRAEALDQKYRTTSDDGYLDGVALNLHTFYSAIERILEDIARTIEGSVPAGPDWHRDLLIQMSAKIPEVRPPVIRRETRSLLDEYRGFRHVVRNVYTFNLQAARVVELTREAGRCLALVKEDLDRFSEFIIRLSKVNDTD